MLWRSAVNSWHHITVTIRRYHVCAVHTFLSLYCTGCTAFFSHMHRTKGTQYQLSIVPIGRALSPDDQVARQSEHLLCGQLRVHRYLNIMGYVWTV
jgi:hypothetical protein